MTPLAHHAVDDRIARRGRRGRGTVVVAGRRRRARLAPPPRVERTLPNGLRVVAVRYGSVPKLTAILGIQSGLAVDPPNKAGLAQFVADLVQEGTASRTSEQIKREAFGMGASLTTAAGQDVTSLQVRGLSETLPGMLSLVGDLGRTRRSRRPSST